MTEDRYTGHIIDSHIHLFDARRPQGIPWPEPDHPLYGVALPANYWDLASHQQIRGAIVVEASPRRLDNFWLLATLRQSPGMLGFIGNLSPFDMHFHDDLSALEAEPLFLGLRYGNLWDRDLLDDQIRPGFIEAMRRLAASGRTLDTANPNPRLIKGLLLLSDAVPTLRIVVDHLPNASVPHGQGADFQIDVFELAGRPNVFAKLAEIPQADEKGLVTDPAFYRDRLAYLWEAFGEDRCFFGSDWPNSNSIADFDSTLNLVRQCLSGKPLAAQEKFFLHNVSRAYSIPTLQGTL
jgi:L-fuconolactonase